MSRPLTVVFRCDASDQMGGGHVMRCLTLAGTLSDKGGSITFVAAAMPHSLARLIENSGHRLVRIPDSRELQRPEDGWEEPPLSAEAQSADANATAAMIDSADWVVVDHYLLDDRWHSAARGFADRVLVIDDLANRTYDCDVLVDQTSGRRRADYRERVSKSAALLLGATYALLRPEFAKERPRALNRRKVAGPVRRILVSLGTADPRAATATIVEQLLAFAPGIAIDVVLGPQATSLRRMTEVAAGHPCVALHLNTGKMAELMRDADLAVGAAGTTSWERCCLGLPTILVVLADNQFRAAEALSAAGAALVVERPDEVGPEVSGLIADSSFLSRMSAAAFAITDGRGATRVLARMMPEAVDSEQIHLRPANLVDAELLWLWRNDPVTRAQSRTSDPLVWEDHVEWLAETLRRLGGCFFVAEQHGSAVGTIRFDPVPNGHEVSLTVASEARGSGCGAEMLRAGCDQIGSGAIYASVREDNEPSRRLFESCGFGLTEATEPGFLRYVLPVAANVGLQRFGA